MWKIILFAASRVTVLMQGIHAISTSHRMKKLLWVDATLCFPFQGHFQGQNIKNVEKMSKKDQPTWEVIFFEASEVNTAVHARSIRNRMKKNLEVDRLFSL